MPVRRFVTEILAGTMRGPHLFRYGVSETITPEQVIDALGVADALYCRVIGLVDWQRILLEAWSRCHGKEDHKPMDQPCGECLHEALLSVDHWGEDAEVHESRIEDWPQAVVDCVSYRRKN